MRYSGLVLADGCLLTHESYRDALSDATFGRLARRGPRSSAISAYGGASTLATTLAFSALRMVVAIAVAVAVAVAVAAA